MPLCFEKVCELNLSLCRLRPCPSTRDGLSGDGQTAPVMKSNQTLRAPDSVQCILNGNAEVAGYLIGGRRKIYFKTK